MKTLDLEIFLPFFFLSLLVLICAVLAWAKFKKLTNENKTELPRHVDDNDLSEWDMGIQFSEQPFIEHY